jgi:ribose transport system substrate-binding protein
MQRARMGRRFLVAAVVAALGVIAAVMAASSQGGTDRSSAPTAKTYRFDFANVTESGPLFVALHKGVAAAAAKTGMKIKFYNNNFDAQTAIRNASLMVQDKPDLIFEYNAVAGIGQSLGNQFRRAKIPCIAVNVPNPGCSWFNLVNKDIGVDTATAVAKVAKSKGWDGTNTVVILVQNATAGEEVNDCVRYFYTTLQNLLPGMDKTTPAKITASTTKIGKTGIQVDGKSALEPSFTALKNVLQTIPTSKNIIVYTVNDDSTIGAWRAVVQTGRASHAITAGLGGSADGLDQLRKNPNWVAEGDIFFPEWGQYLIAMAVAMKTGAHPPGVTTSPQAVLTKETIGHFYKPGQHTPYRLPRLTNIHSNKGGEAKGCPPRNSAPSCGNAYLAKTKILQKFKNVEGLK